MKPIARNLLVHPLKEDNLLFQLVLVFSFALPLFIWPSAHDSFVLPKWVLFQSFTLIAASVLIAQAFFGRPVQLPAHPAVALVIPFLAWQAISRLWSIAPTHTGEQVFETAMLVVWVVVLFNVLLNRRDRLMALAWSLVASSFAVAMWALVLDFAAAFGGGRISVRSVLGDWRDLVSAASLGNSGHVADFIVAGFLVSLAFFLTTHSRIWKWILGADLSIKAAALIICWSVHSNLSLLVGAMVFVVMMYRRVERRDWQRFLRRVAPMGAVWVIVVMFFVVDHPVNPHGSRVWGDDPAEVSGGIFSQAFASDRWKEGGSTRWVIWLTTLEVVKDNPWLGTGAGTFTYAYPGVRSEAIWQHDEWYTYAGSWTNAAHNDALQAWSETGIIGVSLLILLIGAAFLAMVQRRENAGEMQHVVLATTIAMLAAWCVQAQMNFPLELPVSSVLLFALICVPAVLPLSGMEDAFRIPIYRDLGPLRVGAMVENVKRIIAVHVAVVLPKGLAVVMAVVVVIGGVALGAKQATKIGASVHYRPVYEGLRNPRMMQDPQARENLRETAKSGLELNPLHWDLRSALADLYLAEGDYDSALPHLPRIRERLNAWEVYSREGRVFRALGMDDEADESWDVLFSRRPDFGAMFPTEYHRWADRTGADES